MGGTATETDGVGPSAGPTQPANNPFTGALVTAVLNPGAAGPPVVPPTLELQFMVVSMAGKIHDAPGPRPGPARRCEGGALKEPFIPEERFFQGRPIAAESTLAAAVARGRRVACAQTMPLLRLGSRPVLVGLVTASLLTVAPVARADEVSIVTRGHGDGNDALAALRAPLAPLSPPAIATPPPPSTPQCHWRKRSGECYVPPLGMAIWRGFMASAALTGVTACYTAAALEHHGGTRTEELLIAGSLTIVPMLIFGTLFTVTVRALYDDPARRRPAALAPARGAPGLGWTF
jgi:hypothetical protein